MRAGLVFGLAIGLKGKVERNGFAVAAVSLAGSSD